ncbi:sodium:calcium antiporter [Algivirga pacifica]|uniref:Calcium/sodium antiporter n=1 Tax=Algivirga pacifica TaxID=1162670 RepID=A0ABP9DBF8_9BACT
MDITLNLLMLCVGFILLMEGPEHLLEGTASLAKKYRLSEITIGLSLVAFTTSVPELTVSLIAHFYGDSSLLFANLIGSNTFNTMIILGCSALFTPILVKSKNAWRDIPFSLLVVGTLFFIVNDNLFFLEEENILSGLDAFLLLALFFIFLAYLSANQPEDNELVIHEVKSLPAFDIFNDIIRGTITVSAGGYLVITQLLFLSEYIGKSSEFIAIFILAVGTSLPEVATAYTAIRRKRPDIIVSNITGANIYNLTFSLALTRVIGEVKYPTFLNIDMTMTLISTVILFLFIHSSKRKVFGRIGGIAMLLLFGMYAYYVVIRG